MFDKILSLTNYIEKNFPIKNRKTKKEFTDLGIKGQLKLIDNIDDSYVIDLSEFITRMKKFILVEHDNGMYENFIELTRDTYAVRLLKMFFFLINFQGFWDGSLTFEFSKFNKKNILIDRYSIFNYIKHLNSGVLNSINLIKRKCHRASSHKEDLNQSVFKPIEKRIIEIFYELNIETEFSKKFLLISGIRSNYKRMKKTPIVTETILRKPLDTEDITDDVNQSVSTDDTKETKYHIYGSNENLTFDEIRDRVCPPKTTKEETDENINENENTIAETADNEGNNDSQLIQIIIGTQRFDFLINKDNWGRNPIVIKI